MWGIYGQKETENSHYFKRYWRGSPVEGMTSSLGSEVSFTSLLGIGCASATKIEHIPKENEISLEFNLGEAYGTFYLSDEKINQTEFMLKKKSA